MMEEEEETFNYWCHFCKKAIWIEDPESQREENGGELTCPICKSDFIEAIDPADPPQAFIQANNSSPSSSSNSTTSSSSNAANNANNSDTSNGNLNSNANNQTPQMGSMGGVNPNFNLNFQFSPMNPQMGPMGGNIRQFRFNLNMGPRPPFPPGQAPPQAQAHPQAHPLFNPIQMFLQNFHVPNPQGNNNQMGFDGLLQMLFPPMQGQMGDYVFGDQSLDRIISQLMEQYQPRSAAPGVSEQEIDALPLIEITESHINEKTDCPICRDGFKLGEKVPQLRCHHFFHKECITPWVKVNGTCPVCRATVRQTDNQNSNEPLSSNSPSTNSNPNSNPNPNLNSNANPNLEQQ